VQTGTCTNSGASSTDIAAFPVNGVATPAPVKN
jgi:hypothetical protein